jgi:membrane protease YdiL (CAAX protease family)
MDAPAQRSDGFAMAVVVEGGLALVAVVAAWLFHVSLRELFPDDRASLLSAIGRGLLATTPMLAAFWILVNSSWPMLRQLGEQVEWLVGEMFPNGNLAQFATVAVLAGVGEELLFRGSLQTALAHWTTPAIGLVITSLLFGLAHALSKLYFLFAVVVGAFLGWMTLRYNDLVAPIVAHGLYDFLALAYLSRSKIRQTDQPPPSSGATTLPPNDRKSDDQPTAPQS